MTPTESSPTPPARPPGTSHRAAWLREPLVHFLIVGALIFAIDAVTASRSDDTRLITLTTAEDAGLRQLFEDERGRAPTDAEWQALRQRWFDNELLYREGLALGLDRGDSAIRERVIFKALNVVQANLQPPAVDDAALRTWFEQHRARYDDPPRIDFLEAVIEGRPDRAAVAAFVDALAAGAADTERSGLRIFRGRPVGSIREGFGGAFTDRLATLPLQRWQVVDSNDGPRAVLVEARAEGTPADFEAIRERVAQDWRDQRMAELRTEAVRSLAVKYTLRVASQDRP